MTMIMYCTFKIPMKTFQGIKNFSTKNKFYVTTPIYYVNATPHIGHLYSSVIADAARRWRSLVDPKIGIYFSTGTDEHGSKIQQAAARNKESLPKYCENISNKYKELSHLFHVGYTDFIRTTSRTHVDAVHQFWKKINDNGHIYLSTYSGWYCVSDETFLPEAQVKEHVLPDGHKIMVTCDGGHVVEWTEEENYMFKLNSLQDDLKYWLLHNENAVKPKKFHKILLNMITNEDLPDVSVSRPKSRVHWGVSVPGDNTQTVYVWLDALVNYLTVVGYPNIESEIFRQAWPPDLHVIGKDILKFHGVYWPAFLMAANLELPYSILCHSHWTVDGEKMSKSKNNVVCPFTRSDIYTTDGFRYFLLREGVAHSDGNYSDVKIMRILNSELADTYGNLLNRCCGTALNPRQIFPKIDHEAFSAIAAFDTTKKLIESINLLPDICYQHYQDYNFYKVIDSVMATLHNANLFFETIKPWELKKHPEKIKELDTTIHIVLETLRICSIILQPIIPNITENLLNKLNIPRNERYWENIRQQSWNDSNFKTINLVPEKITLFKRILEERMKVGNEN